MTASLISSGDAWPIWALMVMGTALCIFLEQTRRWAARLSGPVLALLFGMVLSNFRFLPNSSPSYDIVEDYLVPVAIPLLLFRANVVKILRGTGSLFLAFHIASIGSVLGAFVATFAFRGRFDHVPEVAGIMTGSYIGGGVNFVAIKNSFQISEQLTNPLLVADNFIMAGMFAALLVIAGSRWFRRLYPHPHSLRGDREDVAALAARHWQRKDIALLDIAQALAVAFAIAAISMMLTGTIKAHVSSRLLQSLFANPYVLITFLTVALATVGHRWMETIRGADELGMYLLYLFFFVIGLRADLIEVIRKVPVLFGFCLVMAVTNLVFTLGVGKLFRLNLEDLLLSVNATLGGAPSAAAMAISRGWSDLVLPGLLVGIWGYVIGTFIGVLVTQVLRTILGTG